MGFFAYKSLFYWFLLTSVLFVFCWFLLLTSTSQSYLVDSEVESSIFRSPNVEGVGTIHWDSGSTQCDQPNDHILKVFMYDLPPKFHFNLLDWQGNVDSVWPDLRISVPHYPGGLNLQHSIEYWLTLDLLHSEFSDSFHGRSARRVGNSSEADVVFVPFFSSLSYNRYSKVKPGDAKSTNVALQEKLLSFLREQKEWKRYGGMDHVVAAHHPNSLLDARMKLWPVTFILSDFGRYPPTIANVDKDVIAPYKHVIKTFTNDSLGGVIRQELYYMLKDEPDVHFTFGSVQKNGIKEATEGMRSSKFCLNIAGDTPSSNRLFDAIASHCVPVIISDEIELPYEDVLDYSKFCIFIRTSDAIKKNFVLNLARNINKQEWTRMWTRLKEIEKLFEFRYPSQENDATQMIWQAVSRKVPMIRRRINRARRLSGIKVPTFESFSLPHSSA